MRLVCLLLVVLLLHSLSTSHLAILVRLPPPLVPRCVNCCVCDVSEHNVSRCVFSRVRIFVGREMTSVYLSRENLCAAVDLHDVGVGRFVFVGRGTRLPNGTRGALGSLTGLQMRCECNRFLAICWQNVR